MCAFTIRKSSCLFLQWLFLYQEPLLLRTWRTGQNNSVEKEAQHQGVMWGEGKVQTGHEGQVSALEVTKCVSRRQFVSTSYLCCPIELQAVLQLEFIILWCYHGPGNSQNPLLSTICQGALARHLPRWEWEPKAAKCALAMDLLQIHDENVTGVSLCSEARDRLVPWEGSPMSRNECFPFPNFNVRQSQAPIEESRMWGSTLKEESGDPSSPSPTANWLNDELEQVTPCLRSLD